MAIVDSIFNKSGTLLSLDKEQSPSWFSAVKHKLLGDYDNGELQPDAIVAADENSEPLQKLSKLIN